MPEQISSYRLEGEIARGGMGIVYRALHTVFDEVVAIKAIFPEFTLNPELRERFLNEAKIQRSLQHPNIVQIREFLIDQENFYIVMEFVEGETLAHRLQQMGRPMLADEAIDIFRQALEGLGFAHRQGVIHRDIKPSNIMLTRQGVAKLTDFGIARALGSAKLTRTGTVQGTPAYMSPEQILGKKLDRRTDIYSMGVMLYEMLTGRVPFPKPEDSDSEYPVITAHVNTTPPPPSLWVPEIPPFLEAAILKALRKRPEERFSSCQLFQAAIYPLALPATRKVLVEPGPKIEKVIPPAPPHRLPPLPPPAQVGAKQTPRTPAGLPRGTLAQPPSSRFGPLTLVGAAAVTVALMLILVPRHRTVAPGGSPYSASTQEAGTTAKPQTPNLAPDASARQPSSPSPSPQAEQVVAPAAIETPSPAPQARERQPHSPSPQPEVRQVVITPAPIQTPTPAPEAPERQPHWPVPQPAVGPVVTPAPIETPRRVISTPERVMVDPTLAAQQTAIRQHTVRAADFIRNRQYADAESEYRAALQLDPQSVDLHISLGMALGLERNWEGQVAEDREALRLNPASERAHLSLGYALSRQNDREGAMAEYREALRLNPASEGAHVSLAIQYSQAGDWDGAIAEYSEALRLHPNNYTVHYSLGVAYERKGDRQSALQEYRTAYELNPNYPIYKQAYDRLSAQ